MNHPFVHRVWRACVALSPVIALTLTITFGRRW